MLSSGDQRRSDRVSRLINSTQFFACSRGRRHITPRPKKLLHHVDLVKGTTPQEQESSTNKASGSVPPKKLLEEFKRYSPLLVDWLERLYVDCYALGLRHTECAGWHLLLNVSDEHYEVVLSKLHEMPETDAMRT
jgi:hypothetical protein